MVQTVSGKVADSADPYETASMEQSDQGLHCLCGYILRSTVTPLYNSTHYNSKILFKRYCNLQEMALLFKICILYTVELQWLEHLWNHEKMFETGVV